ncbi:MAG: GNAT family N-acetyltransferase [Candidatus Dormibacteria bacterium]
MPQLPLPIQTERLTLRQLLGSDLEQLLEIQSLPDVARYMYWAPRSPEAARQWLNLALPLPSWEVENEALTLAAVELASGRLAGTLTLFLRSIAHRQGEIGFMFHPDFQGRGLAAEGAAELFPIGFELLQLHRLFGRCDGRNLPSARLMERLGMRQEARLLQNEMVKGKWTDEWIYAILASEWRLRQH